MDSSIRMPIFILYPFKNAYKRMASCSLTEQRCLVGTIIEHTK